MMSPSSGSSTMVPLQLNFFLHSFRITFLLILGFTPCTVVRDFLPLRCWVRMWMYPDCTESADCFSLAGAPSSSAKSKLGPASAKQKGKGEIKRQRVSARPLREETLAKRQTRVGGDARGVRAVPGTRPARGERHRSIARRSRHPPIGRRAVPSTERSKDVPTEGWPIPADDRRCRGPRRKAPPRRCPAVPARATVRPRARVDTGGEPCTSPKAWRSRAAFSRRARPRAVSVETRPAGVGRHRVAREKKRVRDHPRRSGNRRGAKREGRTRAYRGWTGRQP
mmetsp:Transcript_13719/g.58632  ORF Transcript_13719/g.58632 Transcript_13719/m.58632 type:complete len:281 (+) Transcript_13719:3610-4452(+)